ncbi:restriction endonuclease subunit S [Streptomyces sp. NPDC047046]|uniref:restriction endonuclease subunit S n=1 Tax=Streptomyces sp. NPDC047046 TaxID=3155378 RepID=UPI0033EE8A9D
MTSYRIKDVAVINRRSLPEETDPDYRFRYVDIAAVQGGKLSIPAADLTFASAPSRARRLAPPGAVLVSTVRTYLRAIAAVPASSEALVFSTGFAVLEAGDEIDSRYLAYHCHSQPFIGEVVARSTGVSYPAINASDIGLLPIRLPSLEEQRRIADFLDTATARIDHLAGLLVQQTRLLEERRLRRIAESVFDVAPSERSRRLHSVAEVILGRQRAPQHTTGDHMVPYLRAANVKDGRLDLSDVMEMNFSPTEQEVFALRAGDVLVTEGSGSLSAVGASSVWQGEIPGTVCFQNTLLRMRPRSGLADGAFLEWWARAAFAAREFASIATGANIFHLSAERVRSLPTRFPPLRVQQEIAGRLARETVRIDRFIAMRERQQALLAERRQALITAAVTGQFDVSSASGRNVTEGIAS